MRASTILATAVMVVLTVGTVSDAAVEDGLQGYWEFEGDGTDSVGAVHLTDLGGTSYGTSGAVAGQYVTTSAGTSQAGFTKAVLGTTFSITTEFTVSGWVRPENIGNTAVRAPLIAWGAWTLGVYSWDYIYQHGAKVKHNGGPLSVAFNSSQTPGTWYHFVQVVRSDGSVEVWHADKQVGDHVVPNYTATIAGYSNVDVSGLAGGALNVAYIEAKTSGACISSFDEVAVWNRALSTNEIEEVFDRGKRGRALDIRLDDGLRGYWQFEGNGSDAMGATDLSPEGTISYGSSSPLAGQYVRSVSQAAGPSSRMIGSADSFGVYDEVTISGWFRYEAGSAGAFEGKMLAGLDNGKLNCYMDVDAIGGDVYSYAWYVTAASVKTGATLKHTGQSHSIGTWYHAVLRIASDGSATYWVADAGSGDTSVEDSWSWSSHERVLMSDHSRWIVAEWETKLSNPGGTMNVDEVAIWNRALSDAEIQQVFDVGKAGSTLPTPSPEVVELENGLQSYWPLDGGGGDVIGGADVSPMPSADVTHTAVDAMAGKCAVTKEVNGFDSGLYRNPSGTTFGITDAFTVASWYRIDAKASTASKGSFHLGPFGYYNPDDFKECGWAVTWLDGDGTQRSYNSYHDGTRHTQAASEWWFMVQIVDPSGKMQIWMTPKGNNHPYIYYAKDLTEQNSYMSIDTGYVSATGIYLGFIENKNTTGTQIATDEVAIWNRALNASEINELFTRGKAGKAIPTRGTIVIIE